MPFFKIFNLFNLLFFLLLLAFIFISGCEKDTSPIDNPLIQLNVADVGVTETWLHLELKNSNANNQISILRGDSTIQQFTNFSKDSIIYDQGLLPGRSYTYKAIYQAERLTLTAESRLTTMDTTSHDFTWETVTFGAGTVNELKDVYIINSNNIWAVGEIHTEETDRFDTLGNWIDPYNAVHWNGSEWELKRILYMGGFWEINTIYAFSENDIWFEMAVRWNGIDFEAQPIPGILIGQTIQKMWGRSSDDLYIVGYDGLIAHYNRDTWQRLESGTDVRLRDVWGSPDSDVVWACGWEDFKPTVLLKIENGTVTKVYEDTENQHTVKTDRLSGPLIGGMQLSKNRHYILSHSGLYSTYIQNNTIYARRFSFTSSYFPGFPFGIDGNGENDVFIAGERFMIAHFNGYSWKHFDSLMGTGRRLYSIAQKGNSVVAVGRTFDFFNKAVIIKGNR